MKRKYGNYGQTLPEGNPLSTAKNIPETRIKENNAALKEGYVRQCAKIVQPRVEV